MEELEKRINELEDQVRVMRAFLIDQAGAKGLFPASEWLHLKILRLAADQLREKPLEIEHVDLTRLAADSIQEK